MSRKRWLRFLYLSVAPSLTLAAASFGVYVASARASQHPLRTVDETSASPRSFAVPLFVSPVEQADIDTANALQRGLGGLSGISAKPVAAARDARLTYVMAINDFGFPGAPLNVSGDYLFTYTTAGRATNGPVQLRVRVSYRGRVATEQPAELTVVVTLPSETPLPVAIADDSSRLLPVIVGASIGGVLLGIGATAFAVIRWRSRKAKR